MSDTSHSALAAVLPYAEPVLISPPLILVWCGHGSTFLLCSGSAGIWQGRTSGINLTLRTLRTGSAHDGVRTCWPGSASNPLFGRQRLRDDDALRRASRANLSHFEAPLSSEGRRTPDVSAPSPRTAPSCSDQRIFLPASRWADR